ncbi:hypothetical protein [Limimaricola cinnabarinus]|uniref:hypothetical protein n=1 Tax=Limimaricola cinnabarinus TaxID=1125964 RepID=UPI002491E484|nr:hypothetical protein [Limimaricola cinnabarinus]
MAEGFYLDICLISYLRKHRHCIMITQEAGAGDFTPLLDRAVAGTPDELGLDEAKTVEVTVAAATASRGLSSGSAAVRAGMQWQGSLPARPSRVSIEAPCPSTAARTDAFGVTPARTDIWPRRDRSPLPSAMRSKPIRHGAARAMVP